MVNYRQKLHWEVGGGRVLLNEYCIFHSIGLHLFGLFTMTKYSPNTFIIKITFKIKYLR